MVVQYHAELGYPLVADLDPNADVADDELFLSVTDFTVIGRLVDARPEPSTNGPGWASQAITLAIAGLATIVAVSTPVHSQARLKILADTPLRAALIEIGEAFRRDGGQQVDFVFGPSPVILKKLADGEAADVVIAQPEHISDLIRSAKVVPGEYPVIGRVGLGLAVRADAPTPSIATVEALRQVLLHADTVVTNTVVSGDQFVAMLETLNIADVVGAKVVRLPPGPRLYDTVIQGKGNDIGAGVITVIKETKGIRLLGPLPAEIQRYQAYAAAPMIGAASPAAARRFVAFLASPAAKALFSASGVEGRL